MAHVVKLGWPKNDKWQKIDWDGRIPIGCPNIQTSQLLLITSAIQHSISQQQPLRHAGF
jgi:hypothetical protein